LQGFEGLVNKDFKKENDVLIQINKLFILVENDMKMYLPMQSVVGLELPCA
jgi:hypothetical protein